VKYLATFAEEDASTLNEAKEEAVRAVIEFVKSPDMFQVFMLPKCDLDIFNNKY
jgi:translation initiation factor 3 subunit M